MLSRVKPGMRLGGVVQMLALVCVTAGAWAFSGELPIQGRLDRALRGTAAVAIVLDGSSGKVVAVRNAREAAWRSSTPGSTLKPFFLEAALERGLIREDTLLYCRRPFRISGHELTCTHPAAVSAVRADEAIAYSCNRYFAQVAGRFGRGETAAVLREFGFGSRPHLFGDESAGEVTDPKGEAEAALQVLGIAEVSATPAQMAEAYWLLERRADATVRRGLEESVEYGMAHAAATEGISLVGKTGTASDAGERGTHGWFAGLASRGGRSLVLVIFVPRGNGGDAALLAHRFLAAWQTEPSAGPLTVEVFSTRQMQTLRAIPLSARDWMRACASCAKKPVTGALSFDGAKLRDSELGGVFRVGDDAGEIVADGLWKVRSRSGHVQLRLTMDSERYVAMALAGEAAPDEPLESLKAMAVAIRTYALENLGRHAGEGFDLCDSTHCQALRYGKPAAAVERAVLETAGETLWYGGRRAAGFYTQNCGGMTEAAANVWPGLQAPYLAAHRDPYCQRRGAVRWETDISGAEAAAIFRREGWRAPDRIESARVVKQTASGRAQLLEFDGNGRRAPVSASSFRFAVDRSLGWNRVRSDWYTVAAAGGALHISGRGYGHGVGLCQAGAHEMADEGGSYREILAFYFPGTKVGVEESDGGWRAEKEDGWTFASVGAAAELRSEAAAAWIAAQRLFPPRAVVRPTVRVFPTTELFRESAQEPGWALAATRGTEIFTQPGRVLSKNGPAKDTLLHEFLHVLVEREASPSAPLWLREGLVEALSHAGERETPNIGPDPAAMDAALARPASYEDSLRAHRQAGVVAGALVAAYGVEQVRGWLRTGVPREAIRRAMAATY